MKRFYFESDRGIVVTISVTTEYWYQVISQLLQAENDLSLLIKTVANVAMTDGEFREIEDEYQDS